MFFKLKLSSASKYPQQKRTSQHAIFEMIRFIRAEANLDIWTILRKLWNKTPCALTSDLVLSVSIYGNSWSKKLNEWMQAPKISQNTRNSTKTFVKNCTSANINWVKCGWEHNAWSILLIVILKLLIKVKFLVIDSNHNYSVVLEEELLPRYKQAIL